MPRRNNTISHQPFQPGNGNHGTKKRFATEREALQAAEYQMSLKSDLKLRVYKCLECGGWHLTRQQKDSH